VPLVSVEHLAPMVMTERRDLMERKVSLVLLAHPVARDHVGLRDLAVLECLVLLGALEPVVFPVLRDLLVAVVPLVPMVFKDLQESLALMVKMVNLELMANLVLMENLVLMVRRVPRETAANPSCKST